MMSSPASQRPSFNLPLGYLRAFIILLVVEHHSVLAYYPKRPPVALALTQSVRWWLAFPVVDRVQWSGFYPLVIFNDIYFMSLLFLLSGLFTWHSMQRRGIRPFLRQRFLRLGIPFLVANAFSPLAYYPAYLQSITHDGFWHEWLALGGWSGGPAWFLWVLLTFDCLAAAAFASFPDRVLTLSRRLSRIKKPGTIAGLFLLLAALAYIPSAAFLHPYKVFQWGPFFIQRVRVLLYIVCFFFGVVLGAVGPENTILDPGSRLPRQWPFWTASALLAFAIHSGLTFLSHRFWAPGPWRLALACAFALSCVCTSFALLAIFLRFVKKRRPLLDSLLACSFGIYLFHFPFVSWTQWVLLHVGLPAIPKAAIVFVTALAGTWCLTILLRRSRLVASIL